MTRGQRLFSGTTGLLRNQQGAAAIVIAASLAAMTLLGGLAVDAGRAHLVKGRLTAALDAGALAGGRVLGSGNPTNDAKMFYYANLAGGLNGVTLQDPVVTIGTDQMSLSMSATASLSTSFLKIAGINTLDVSASNTVRRVNYGMELALIMDNTGSMDANGKMVALRAAATDLINILYGGQTTVPDFWVAVVPYAAMVNIGPQRTTWVDQADLATKNYANTTWKGCVEARLGAGNTDKELDDDPPSVQRWKAFFYPSTASLYAAERATINPATGAPYKGDNDWTKTSIKEQANPGEDGNRIYGPNVGCPDPILPLTADKNTVLQAIQSMEPWFRGGTFGNLGLAWGWRTLSPRWRGLWGGATPSKLPLKYDAKLSKKVAILLTDGVNEWYDWPEGLPGAPMAAKYPDADYTAYGRPSQNRLGTTSNANAPAIINSRILGLCQAMKDNGINIFTVTFQASNAALQAVYRSCASAPNQYFDSPTPGELQQVFRQIGSQISNLRLEK